MKILVTGANGYLGQGIIKSLSDRGLDVIATDFKCDYVDKRAQSIACNLFEIDNPYDPASWRLGFDDSGILDDVMVHHQAYFRSD